MQLFYYLSLKWTILFTGKEAFRALERENHEAHIFLSINSKCGLWEDGENLDIEGKQLSCAHICDLCNQTHSLKI